MKNFQLEILNQYWITKDDKDESDLCSHGQLEIVINDKVISNVNDDKWTISTTGLMLLRTITRNHSAGGSFPIVQHCGQLAMLGCPKGIDWTVEHFENSIFIKDIKKCPTTNKNDVINFDVTAIIDRKNYISEVIRFCECIKDYYKDKPRTFSDEFCRQEWISFWAEFDILYLIYKKETSK